MLELEAQESKRIGQGCKHLEVLCWGGNARSRCEEYTTLLRGSPEEHSMQGATTIVFSQWIENE